MADKSTHFGKCLKHIRKSEHLTLQSLADKLGISKSFISEVERGEKEPGYKLIKSLKRTYPELNLNYLIGEEGASDGTERLDILERRVNHLLGLVQEYPIKYGFQDIVRIPLGGKEKQEYITLPVTLVKYNNSLAFYCTKDLPPRITKGNIVIAAPEIELKDQELVLLSSDNRQFLAQAHRNEKNILLTDDTGQEISMENPHDEKKILGIVYMIIKTLH
ncbi:MULTISPECIES: helix-turn-helix domain-containing protein [Prosthecochloris]|nr:MULTISPECIES: helix-turn-helix transcriptional regulator [Prosthecochloris]UZJ40081.1 helix-turn-helix transcriptional regulator [Prosthecochloris sp. SCSIO W1102]